MDLDTEQVSISLAITHINDLQENCEMIIESAEQYGATQTQERNIEEIKRNCQSINDLSKSLKKVLAEIDEDYQSALMLYSDAKQALEDLKGHAQECEKAVTNI